MLQFLITEFEKMISCCQQTYSNMSFFQPKFLNTSQPSTIYQSAYDGSRKTVLIVHGFIDTGFVHWVRVSGRYLSKHFQIRVLSMSYYEPHVFMYPFKGTVQ